jgi:hypothetical protein
MGLDVLCYYIEVIASLLYTARGGEGSAQKNALVVHLNKQPNPDVPCAVATRYLLTWLLHNSLL